MPGWPGLSCLFSSRDRSFETGGGWAWEWRLIGTQQRFWFCDPKLCANIGDHMREGLGRYSFPSQCMVERQRLTIWIIFNMVWKNKETKLAGGHSVPTAAALSLSSPCSNWNSFPCPLSWTHFRCGGHRIPLSIMSMKLDKTHWWMKSKNVSSWSLYRLHTKLPSGLTWKNPGSRGGRFPNLDIR